MSDQSVLVTLPQTIYEQLRTRAGQRKHTLAEEVRAVVTEAVQSEALPTDLADAIAPLHLLDDTALWQAARTRLRPESVARLEELHSIRQQTGLTDAEDAERAALITQYERVMLVRARAAALLHERGHDVSSLLQHP